MKIKQTDINGVKLVEQCYLKDERGFFGRLFCLDKLKQIIGHRQIVQINHSGTHQKGTVRGLHFQHSPQAEMKLIRCIKGRVWDVAVDLRQHSPTFLHWVAQELSADNGIMMVIPEGCAHGFQVLDDNSELIYLHTAPYSPEFESGVYVQDSTLAIEWPLPVIGLSLKDQNLPKIDDHFVGIQV